MRTTSIFKCVNDKIAPYQTGSRSFWSLAKVFSQDFCHSSFRPQKTALAHLHALLPLKLTFHINFASMSNIDDHDFQPPLYPTFIFTMSPSKFSTRKDRKAILQLKTSISSELDGIPAIALKSCGPELALAFNKLFKFSYNLGIFFSSFRLALNFPYLHKKVKNVALQAIALF